MGESNTILSASPIDLSCIEVVQVAVFTIYSLWFKNIDIAYLRFVHTVPHRENKTMTYNNKSHDLSWVDL